MTAADALILYLEAQRVEYRRSLPGRLARIGASWRPAAGPPDLATLEREAHSIAGSSGTFGLAAVGEAARVLEQAALNRDDAAIGAAIAALAARVCDAER
jgi:HPt (histidine-containing phosphotransfer) domain-containing protein